MKANTIFVALQYAVLATAAPVFLWSPVGTKTDTPSRPRWQLKPPQMSAETVFRNTRPPASTEYDISFTHRRPKSNTEVAVDGTQPQRLDMDAIVTFTGIDTVISVPVSTRLNTPCHLARLSRQRDDVTVVVLSMVFFLIVLVVESWGFVCQRFRRVAYGHGEIRLEDDEGGKCACGGALSVRCDSEEGEVVAEDEKVGSEVLE